MSPGDRAQLVPLTRNTQVHACMPLPAAWPAWKGRLLEGGAGLRHTGALHVDLSQLAVGVHVCGRARRDRWVLHVKVLLEGRQVAEVLRRKLDAVDVVAAAAAAKACDA